MKILFSVFTLLCFFSIQFFPNKTFAQDKFTLSGYVKDSVSGESLIAASVFIKNNGQGAYTNEFGFYSITLPSGNYEVIFSYVGFISFERNIQLNQDTRLNINLSPKASTLNEVVIETEKKDANVNDAEMGKIELKMERIKTIPAIFGEVDIMKTIQLLPGVQGGTEGTSGFYVRGGGPDQNLVLLDNATVYNTGHLFGFFSVFNADAINSSTLYKGGMPAEYGGRLSSVLDVSMRDGNNKKYHASGGIGVIASRLTLEGPIQKNKSSFIISGRRTYIDVLMRPYIQTTKYKGTGYYFYDLNAKANYTFSDKDRIFLSGYFGRDVFTFKNKEIEFAIPWGNSTATVRWNHLFNNKLFMNVNSVYNDYNFEFDATQQDFNIKFYSGIMDYNLKTDFNYYAHIKHEIKFGMDYTYHIFTPSNITGSSGDVEFDPSRIEKKYGQEAGVYLQDKYTVNKKLELNGGIRASYFEALGPYKKILYNYSGFPSDSIVYGKNEHIKSYHGIEPRLLFKYSIGQHSSIKGSFNLSKQYIHLVASNGTTLPTDIWVPSSGKVKPQIGYQYSVGFFRNFLNDKLETSVEIYYKDLRNQIEYKEGYTPSPNEDLEESFVFGTGNSKGVELYINKASGRFTGWISYTLSFTNRVFTDLNDGKTFPYRYDRRHNISVVASYKLNEHWTLAAVFVYQTGIAYTLPVGKYFIESSIITEYGDVNGYRMAPYNRADLSLTFEGRKRKFIQDGWNFSIYNVYSRQNPYFIYNSYDGEFLNDPVITVQAKQVSLFPIIPSVTWNFKF